MWGLLFLVTEKVTTMWVVCGRRLSDGTLKNVNINPGRSMVLRLKKGDEGPTYVMGWWKKRFYILCLLLGSNDSIRSVLSGSLEQKLDPERILSHAKLIESK